MQETFHTFDNFEGAASYREANGAGGWIALNPDKGEAVLFPWEWTPTRIFAHPLANWNSGCILIGCGDNPDRIDRSAA